MVLNHRAHLYFISNKYILFHCSALTVKDCRKDVYISRWACLWIQIIPHSRLKTLRYRKCNIQRMLVVVCSYRWIAGVGDWGGAIALGHWTVWKLPVVVLIARFRSMQDQGAEGERQVWEGTDCSSSEGDQVFNFTIAPCTNQGSPV